MKGDSSPHAVPWRALEELAGDERYRELVAREFAPGADAPPSDLDRRGFLQLMGASLGLAGLTACTRQPPEKIVPFVEQPENLVPGKPLFYASSLDLDGYARGVLVETHMGRPTKIEGNPEHPASLGATDLLAQASILGLYDPDRSPSVRELGRISTWDRFVGDTRNGLAALAGLGGARLRILTGTVTSPTLAGAIRRLLSEYPRARWHQYSPAAAHAAHAAAVAAFGRPLATRYDFDRARVVVAVESDFLTSGPAALRYARDFMRARRVRSTADPMNRLYVLESAPSLTGASADERLPVTPAEADAFLGALALELGVPGAVPVSGLAPRLERWVAAVARDLEAHRGRSLLVAGDCASAEAHVLAHAVNARLGNLGRTAVVSEPVEAEPVDQIASIAGLAGDMAAGEVDVLLVLGGNPVFDAPADLDFAAAMRRVPRRAHLALYEDETSELCQWHLPLAHELECWGDSRAFDGTLTLRQPLIEPLYGGRSALELVAALTAEGEGDGRELLEAHWRAELGEFDFDRRWRQALHDGMIRDAAPAGAEAPTPDPEAVGRAAARIAERERPELAIALRPDPTIWDGAFANNGWLQECPKPLTKLTWDNAAIVGPALAARLGLEQEQVVELETAAGKVAAPVWIQPGVADGVVTLHLGYGRRRAGRVGTGAGVDAYALRSRENLWSGPVSVRPTGASRALASTQMHHNIPLEGAEAEHRHLVRGATYEKFLREPDFARHIGHDPAPEESLYEPFDYSGHAWGLSVDLTACTGCNACVVACQAENNIPVVGKDQVLAGREMQWLRIDRYFTGGAEAPARVEHQPVMCMHCEQAPCEVVCPVAATTHSPEGINEMTYNRCVGTRYCSNNCPYKVRRFNFLLYQDWETPVLKLLRNPDVTVRSRGVMEKCTYCVQRVNAARIEAGREGRPIRDGEVVTACQQACPTEAIVFGDINDPDSRVARRKALPLDYGILTELSTRPRTTYLARLTNPSPFLADGGRETA